MLAICSVSAFALFLGLTAAQTIIPPTIPVCAQTCTILLDAQRGCVPPAAPSTNQEIYQSCFCLSALLTQLPSSPSVVCPACSSGDQGLLQSWFSDLCKPGAPVNSVPAPAPTTVLVSSTTAGAAPTATSNSSAAGGSTISTGPPTDNRSWMKIHWKWVVMLIVLFFGFIILAWAGSFFHRRYHRRRDGEVVAAASRQPDLGTWGPGHSAHDFGATARSVVGPPINEKGKGRELGPGIEPGIEPEVEKTHQQLETTNGSRRLKKSWLPRKG